MAWSLKSPAAVLSRVRPPIALVVCASLRELRRAQERSLGRVDAIWGNSHVVRYVVVMVEGDRGTLSVGVGWMAILGRAKSPAAVSTRVRPPTALVVCASLRELPRAWQRDRGRVDAMWGGLKSPAAVPSRARPPSALVLCASRVELRWAWQVSRDRVGWI